MSFWDKIQDNFFFLVRSFHLITLIKCLKGHKSLGDAGKSKLSPTDVLMDGLPWVVLETLACLNNQQ